MTDPDPDEVAAAEGAFLREDYRFTADLLRRHISQGRTDLFRATCSNNLNIILAALDEAGREPEDDAA